VVSTKVGPRHNLQPPHVNGGIKIIYFSDNPCKLASFEIIAQKMEFALTTTNGFHSLHGQ